MGITVDLNCDMGESFGVYGLGDDEAMLDLVTSANIACGFHAGDPLVMRRTVERALARGVAVGAHPGFLDLWGFGRRPIHGDPPEAIEETVIYQVGALQAVAKAVGHKVTHVKPHGALYDMAATDEVLADAIAHAVQRVDPDLVLVVMAGTAQEFCGERRGLRLAREVFADRTYEDDGRLMSRRKAGAVIDDPDLAAERVLRMIEEQAVTTVGGRKVPVRIDTVCVHGDTPSAVRMARTLRRTLEASGVTVAPFARH